MIGMIPHLKSRNKIFVIVACYFLLSLSQPYVVNSLNITVSEYNRYTEDTNISVMIAIDSQLVGEENFFSDLDYVKTVFNFWLIPFETKFNINFHVSNVVLYTPGENDNLSVSIVKVPEALSWELAENGQDENNNGNMYDFLIIYQKNYLGGRNRVNAIEGNALIIAHNQLPPPLGWTSRQLILLHEVGHIFGAEHHAEGVIPGDWYGTANKSIMSYTDLGEMHLGSWDTSDMPVDDHNYAIINASRSRFAKNDADLDGMPNYYEYRYGLDPSNNTVNDTDDDGIGDLDEYIHGTNPIIVDSDEDSFSDWAEVELLSSPINSSSIPSLNTPLLFSLTPNQMLEKNQNLTLRWRGIGKYRNSYSVLLNNSIIKNSDWTEELIQYKINSNKVGTWNYSCKVTDTQGNSVSKSILITVSGNKDNSTGFYFSFFAFLIIIKFLQGSKIKNKEK
ncbi:MAG: hypothetical protein ACXABI_08335 [Candidatus Hodarchaeales archaeon]|jgi:hypothetical protein